MKNKIIEIKSTAMIEGIEDRDRYIAVVNGQFEARFQQVFDAILKKDAVIFDIGANIGIISIILDRVVPGAQIYAVEAGEQIMQVLQRNLAANHASSVEPLHCAVAAYDGSISFVTDSAYGHATSDADGANTQTLPCYTIDTLAKTYAPTRLDFIKLDIEGFETQALDGASWTIETLNPMFLMELNPWCISNYGKSDPAELVRRIFRDFRYAYLINKSDWTNLSPVLVTTAEEVIKMFEAEPLFCDDLLFSNNEDLPKRLSKWIGTP